MASVGRRAAGALGLAALCASPATAQQPADLDTTGMTRVKFAQGTTSGIVNDSLAAGGEQAYLIGAYEGQVMLVHAIGWQGPGGSGRRGETAVRVARADGRELPSPGGAGPLWSGRLPADGDYVVRVRAAGGPTPYTLAVQIPRRLDLAADDPEAAIAGEAPSRAPVDYLVEAERGSRLEARVESGGNGAHLHIYGLDDGVQLAPLSARRERYAGRVPSTQDYVVSVVPAGERASYDLEVTLTR